MVQADAEPALSETGLFYARVMEDILVLAPTRWKLRRALGLANESVGALRLAKRPDKTFIAGIEHGVDFLAYHFTADSLTLAVGTLANFVDCVSRLDQQERERRKGPSLPGAYVRLGHPGLPQVGAFEELAGGGRRQRCSFAAKR